MRLLTLVAALPALCAVTLAAGCTLRLGPFTSGGHADSWTEADERFDLSADGIDCIAITTHNGRIEVAAGAPDDATSASPRTSAPGATIPARRTTRSMRW